MTRLLLSRPSAPLVPEAAASARPARTLAGVLPAWTLATLSVLALWFVGYVLVIGAAQEQGDQQRLFARFRSELSQATAPVGPVAEGKPVALIDAPRGGIRRAVVVEGTTSQDLQAGPGHRRDTVLPGQAGVSVVFGKGATFGAPFKRIDDLKVGDPISVVTAQGSVTFHVSGRRHAGDPLPAPPAAGAGRLTLVTVEGSGWRSGWAPTRTTYVDATVDKAQPTTGKVAGVSADEQALATSTDALLPLVLWLEALLVVVVAGAWATARWGRWQTWLVAAPALTAVLVGTSRVAATLLPNLF